MKRVCTVLLFSGMLMGGGCFLLPGPGGSTSQPALRPFESAAELAAFLNAEQIRRSSDGIGIFPIFALEDAAPPLAPSEGAEPTGGAGDGSFSTTTVQEPGVDEGDMVKNDGTYLYVLRGSHVRIVQAQPPESLAEVARVQLSAPATALYLRENQLIALSSTGGFFIADPVILDAPVGVAVPPEAAQSADEQSVTIAPEEPQVKVTVIDVTERTAPAIVRTVTVEGHLVDSRLVDGNLHLILQDFPQFPVEPLTEETVGALLPRFAVESSSGSNAGVLIEPTDVLHPIEPNGVTLSTVSTVNVDSGEIQAISVVGSAEILYASTNALYLAGTVFEGGGGLFAVPADESTEIHKIALTAAGPSYVGSGKVPGRPLDQYSFSEYQDHLRIATTSNAFAFDGESSNNVFVLRETQNALSIVGRLEGIAPGEQIFSARFVGERGFLVTFVRIDPLFTLDLSDPENPTIVGELKVPGFSTFLLPISESELLAVGRDATEEGRPLGVQLSLFEVSNFANPVLKDKITLGLSGSWSEALDNPKALTWFGSQRMAALPATLVQAGGGGEDFLGGVSFSGLIVLGVDAAGFQELGRISTIPGAGDEIGFFPSSAFTRGVFMGESVFAVTPDVVRGAPTANVNGAPFALDFE